MMNNMRKINQHYQYSNIRVKVKAKDKIYMQVIAMDSMNRREKKEEKVICQIEKLRIWKTTI